MQLYAILCLGQVQTLLMTAPQTLIKIICPVQGSEAKYLLFLRMQP